MTELRKERRESKWEKRDGVLSAFRSTSFRAVNFVPFHGRQPGPVKTAAEKTDPPGVGVGGSEGRAVPHTHPCSFFPVNNLSPSTLPFLSHTHFNALVRTHTSFRPSLRTQLLSSLLLLLLFFSLYLTDMLPMRDIPPASLSPKAPTNPREPCCRTLRVVAWRPKAPSFISSRFGKD